MNDLGLRKVVDLLSSRLGLCIDRWTDRFMQQHTPASKHNTGNEQKKLTFSRSDYRNR